MQAYEKQAYAAMRIVTGFLFLCHGLSKVFGLLMPVPAGAPALVIWTAGPIELVGGVLVMIGLFPRPAAFLCSGLMAFAYLMAHGTKALFPNANGGEPAVVYTFAFLMIAANGAGLWSVDGARGALTLTLFSECFALPFHATNKYTIKVVKRAKKREHETRRGRSRGPSSFDLCGLMPDCHFCAQALSLCENAGRHSGSSPYPWTGDPMGWSWRL